MMPQKKVLIICDAFPPAFAPRMGYLCKHLAGLGWQAVIVTEHINQNLFQELARNQTVEYVNIYKAQGRFSKKCEWLRILTLDYFFNYKDRLLIKAAQKQLKLHPCDIILASSYRTFPLYAAYQLSQKYALPLIVDLRDIIEQYTNQEFFAHYKNRIPLIGNLIARLFKNKLLSQRNKILQKADYVTTISEWHVDTLKAYNAKTHLIYNGFDADLFTPAIQKSKQFLICYTGRILSTAMRNPALLFEAVKQLHNEHRIDTKEFRIQFFTNAESKSILTHAAADYQLEDFIEYHDMVAYTEIPAILNNSSILLLLTNKADANGPKGIMTTKFFEYLAVEKPILCITGDEGCLETALNEAQAGLAAHHVDEVKRFIIDQYTTWKNNGYTHIEPNKEALQKYDRKYQAKQFVELFNALCP